MNEREGPSGPQFRANRPAEQDAVRTTIVGGRPPGRGQPVGAVPRGVEILLKKASVDPAFKELLLRDRATAAHTIGLVLEPAEAMMLAAIPAGQLEAIIVRTTVPQEHRRAFLGHAAAAMLAALGMAATGLTTAAGEVIVGGCGGIRAGYGAVGNRSDAPAQQKPATVEQRVIELVAKQYKVDKDKVTRDKSLLKDLKSKVRDLITLRKALEKQFNIKITSEAFKKLHTVGDLIDYVENALSKQKPPAPVQGWSGGMRPDKPDTKPLIERSDPVEQANELRRRVRGENP